MQECLQLQTSVKQSLRKALDSLLGSSMTMAANMLLSRRDSYLKSCSKDVTEDDISELRNAPFTSNEVFPVDILSEVQRNFIQLSHVNRDSRNRESRKEHTPRHEEKGVIGLKIGLFTPTMRIHPQAQPKAVPPLHLEIGGEVPTPPGLLEAGLAGGSDCLCPGSCLSSFWQVWETRNAHPRVVNQKWQPVIDLSVVNKYLHVPTFKMETAKNI